jgi:outer membrane protein
MKNKNLIVIALCLLAVLIVAMLLINNFANKKIVYVETGILFEQYEGMKKARIQMELKQKELKAGVDSLVNLFQEDLKTYERNRSKMSAKERELKEELLRVRQQQVNNYHQSIQKKSTEEEQRLTQTQVNRINDFLKEYGKEKGYRFILGANGSGNVVYALEALNITTEVLEGLNEEYNGEVSK